MRWAQLVLGRTSAVTASDRRYVGILRGAVTALASRGVAVVVSFLAVPLTVGYLGAERYGAWIAISGFVTWFQLADLGLSKGLLNHVAEANAAGRPEDARRYVATTFWLLATSALVVGLAFAAVFPFVDWPSLFNVHGAVATGEVPIAIALALVIFVVSFPLSIVDTVCNANQEGAIANYWSSGANIATLVGIVIVTRSRGGMPALVIAISGVRLLVIAASAVWLFMRHRPTLFPSPRCFDRRLARTLGSDAMQFFSIQIAALIVFSTDNLIIARVLGASRVTPYSVTWKLFSISQIMSSIVTTYLWPAYVDAVARGDARWMVRTFKLSLSCAVGLAIALGVVFSCFGKTIIAFWAGSVAVPTTSLLVWMAGWSVLSAFMGNVACVLNATRHLRGQMIYGIVGAGVNLGLSIWWARVYGLPGVIAATVVALTVISLIPTSIEVGWVFRELRRSEACSPES